MEMIEMIAAVILGSAIFSLISTLIKGISLLDFEDVTKLITGFFMFIGIVGPMLLFQIINMDVMFGFVDINHIPSISDIKGWFLLLIPLITIPLFYMMNQVTETDDVIYDC